MDNREGVLQIARELSGRWITPIMVELESCGGRFTPLQTKLNITPSRLSDNLKHLADIGLIRHLMPHERRHPLLPEYRITDKGRFYRQASQAIRHAESTIGHGELSFKAWNWPILLALDYGFERFQEIKETLKPITPRMLSMRLDELSTDGLILKTVQNDPRPSFLYHLSDPAKKPVRQLRIHLTALLQ